MQCSELESGPWSEDGLIRTPSVWKVWSEILCVSKVWSEVTWVWKVWSGLIYVWKVWSEIISVEKVWSDENLGLDLNLGTDLHAYYIASLLYRFSVLLFNCIIISKMLKHEFFIGVQSPLVILLNLVPSTIFTYELCKGILSLPRKAVAIFWYYYCFATTTLKIRTLTAQTIDEKLLSVSFRNTSLNFACKIDKHSEATIDLIIFLYTPKNFSFQNKTNMESSLGTDLSPLVFVPCAQALNLIVIVLFWRFFISKSIKSSEYLAMQPGILFKFKTYISAANCSEKKNEI